MIKPFLYSVAETYYRQYGSDLGKVRFVFPNRRACVFFQKYLAQISTKTIFLPELTTINQFFYGLSDFEPSDNLDLLFELYHIYLKATGIQESFDEFYFWGNILLSDFDEIDKYRVDAEKLYSNIVSLKEIEANFGGLDEEQLEAIRSFWANFKEGEQGEIKDAFLKNWESLYPVYTQFNAFLKRKKTGYEGLIYRQLAENLEKDHFKYDDDKITVFAGFNALNKCEESIFSYFQKFHQAEFCWDYSKSPFLSEQNYASFFMKKYLQMFPQKEGLQLEFNPQPEFKAIAVPSVTGQAYLCHNLVQDMAADKEADLTQKVLLLSDESLLSNVLYSIPEQLETLNITMGYPVKNSITLAFIHVLVSLIKNSRISGEQMQWYSRDVLDILQHEWVRTENNDAQLTDICKNIVDGNLIFWQQDKAFKEPLLRAIFSLQTDPNAMAQWLVDVLDILLDAWVEQDQKDDSMASIEKEILLFLSQALSKLSAQIQKSNVVISKDIVARIIYRATEGQTIPFEGEPLSGLQLMGVLESRTIDFDEIVFLSFNERMFPRRSPDNTFIPYNLRKGYGLTTVEYHDSMYSYYFYRLLQRAKKVTMVYNTAQSGIYPGEPSRYLLQLKYLYNIALQEDAVVFEPGLKSTNSISIQASDETDLLLKKYLEGGEKFLSASALNTYLNCSLKFYFMYLQGLKEEEDIEEEIDARVFGSIYHQAIEELYKPYEKQILTYDILKQLAKSPEVDNQIRIAMAKHYFKCPPEKAKIDGQFRIIFNVLKKYLLKTFEVDTQFAPFTYVEGEQEVSEYFEIEHGLKVRLGGYIDRLDEVDGEVRVLDYKTGQAEKRDMAFAQIQDVFEPGSKRPKYVFQTLFYMLLFRASNPEVAARPGIYFLRNFYDSDFVWDVKQKEGRKYFKINDFNEHVDEFALQLKHLLNKIFIERTDFVQTEDFKNCEYCPFKKVCMR